MGSLALPPRAKVPGVSLCQWHFLVGHQDTTVKTENSRPGLSLILIPSTLASESYTSSESPGSYHPEMPCFAQKASQLRPDRCALH